MNTAITTIATLALIIILLGIFAGCKPIQPTPIEIVNNTENNQTLTGVADDVVSANNQFALDLYNQYKSNEGNLFFSPYSISSALTMAYEGAIGKTAEEMQAVLHLPNDKEKVRAGFLAINNELNQADKPYKLSVANALWAQKDYAFKQDYFDIVENYYGGTATNLDFKQDTENSRLTINKWVEDKTNDKIKDLIPAGSLLPTTRLVITNAIYFKANWSYPFDKESTIVDKFKLSSGETVDARMMGQTDYFNYGETDKLQFLEMDYQGGDLSMLIILPKTNDLSQAEKVLTRENIDNWKAAMSNNKVEVTMPTFEFETKYFMAGDLAKMGMPTAFTPFKANFSGMTKVEDLNIDEVIHQAFINVTESGTEAAAATAVIMVASTAIQGPPPPPPKIFKADHPFIFIIQQKESGNILFIGRVSDPSK